MIPMSAVWAGEARDLHFKGPPLLFGKTEGSTPFRFSLHVGDVGHTLVVGPTGCWQVGPARSDALQFRRYPNSQVFAFDFGGSIRAAALAMGGDWHDLGGALSDGGDKPVALQPLAWIDDASERDGPRNGSGRSWRGKRSRLPRRSKIICVCADLSRFGAMQERTLTGLSVLLQSNS